jgi:hypothetical protein
VGPRCRKGHPSGVMPHRRSRRARSRRRLPARWRGRAPARPQPRPRACSLPASRTVPWWSPGGDASPAYHQVTVESNFCSTRSVDLVRATTSSWMPTRRRPPGRVAGRGAYGRGVV